MLRVSTQPGLSLKIFFHFSTLFQPFCTKTLLSWFIPVRNRKSEKIKTNFGKEKVQQTQKPKAKISSFLAFFCLLWTFLKFTPYSSGSSSRDKQEKLKFEPKAERSWLKTNRFQKNPNPNLISRCTICHTSNIPFGRCCSFSLLIGKLTRLEFFRGGRLSSQGVWRNRAS